MLKYCVMFCCVSALVNAAELGVYRGDLVSGHVGAAAEGHVLLGMRHSGEARGSLIATGEVILFDRHYGAKGSRTMTTRSPLSSVARVTVGASCVF